MDRQLKQQFTLRITQANKTELCVILYEMFMTYCSDAICNQEQGDMKEFRLNIQRARGCLKELMGSLHFEYEPAPTLLKLYIYISRLRQDVSVENGFSFWCVADDLRAGTAQNAYNILETLLKK